jgi:hypothetical protein
VRGIALMETFLRPQSWAELPPEVVEHSRALRTPGLGETMLLEENFAIEGALPHPFAIQTGISQEDLDVYRAPYPDPASRRPLLQWPREIPFDREPADVADRVDAYGRWLADTPEVPKLLLTVEQGVGIASPEIVAWAKEHANGLEVEGIGPAGHQAPEDQPDAIGQANRPLAGPARPEPARQSRPHSGTRAQVTRPSPGRLRPPRTPATPYPPTPAHASAGGEDGAWRATSCHPRGRQDLNEPRQNIAYN